MDVVRRKLMLATIGTYEGLRLRSIDRIPELEYANVLLQISSVVIFNQLHFI